MQTKVIYEDEAVLVCYKPAGLAVQTAVSFQEDMVNELKNYLSTKNGGKNPYLGVIHRLDQPVEGLLVFGKTKQAAAELTAQLTKGTLSKKYIAVLCGIPDKEQGELVDYLRKNPRTNLAQVVSEKEAGGGKGEAKRAQLRYGILAAKEQRALAEIEIKTGRFHQIRAQMSHMGYPLWGDVKYGAKVRGQLALCAHYLEFENPLTGKRQIVTIEPENPVFKDFLEKL